jgi:glucose-6-phosphate-specific signal transduction histidine kinase
VALLFLPVAFVLGLVIRDARRASVACLLVWLAAMVGWLVAKVGGAGVSPWEALALVVCLAPAILLARLAVRLRRAAPRT